MEEQKKNYSRFGRSEQGNFEIIDEVWSPHPYCIGARHVAHASDHFGGRLNQEALESAERSGIMCATCKEPYSKHEKALVVSCSIHFADADKKMVPELHQWLLKIKDAATAEGYAGFAFKDDRPNA